MNYRTDTNNEPTKEVRSWNGIPLNITTKTGEPRFSFAPPMSCDYGCIRGSWGAGLDGKALDVYVVSDAPTVFKVVQITPAGTIDEYKYVLGAQNFDEAVETFLKHVPRHLFGAASQYSIAQLQDDIAQQSKVKKDADDLTEFVEQLEALIESDDAYGSNVYVLSFEVVDNGDITGKFEDAWNGRVFSYSVQKDRIGYKPALTLDRMDSATAAKRFDIFSSGYTSLGVRQDAAKSGKKPRCTTVSYSCGRACIQLKNTCWINSSGQKVKKAGGAVASISQGRIDKLRTLARYLAANGNNKWSKYGSAELLAAKANNLEGARNRLIASGVKKTPIETAKSATPKQVLVLEDKLKTQKFESMAAFDSEGKQVAFLDGEQYSVEIPEAMVPQLKDTIITHNHPMGLEYPKTDPRRLGNSFSMEDIDLLYTVAAAEMRAVSPGYRHSMKPPKDGWKFKSRNEIVDALINIETGVKKDFQAKVNSGELNYKNAEANHQHEIMTRFSQKYETIYERTLYKKAPK